MPERIARVNLLPVPPGLAPEVAALVEPLACCLRGVERAEIEPGDTVAVLGAGPIGLMLCACVSDAGGRPVLVGGRAERRALAPAFGAEPGDGCDADVAIEATGSADGWRDALSLVRTGGTAVMFGGLPAGTEVAVDAYRVHYDELTVRGAFHHAPQHVRAALAFLASGARPWATLLTHEVSLEGLPGLFADPPRDYLKAVVRPRRRTASDPARARREEPRGRPRRSGCRATLRARSPVASAAVRRGCRGTTPSRDRGG